MRRIVYMGTPELAVEPLRALHGAGYVISLVVTRPDARRGRGARLTPSPVKKAATELGLEVSHDVDAALDVDADLAVVVAFGQLIRPHVLERLAMVNMHFSLLPRWRGAAPVERAILAGDAETGVCIMVLEEELDVGAVYACEAVPISDEDDLEGLRAKLVTVGTRLLLDELERGFGDPVPQAGEVTWAHKVTSDELRLDWNQPAEYLARVVRLGNAWTTARGRRLKVWRARAEPDGELAPGQVAGTAVGTADGTLVLVEVQPEGKGRRSADDWANGARLSEDERLGS